MATEENVTPDLFNAADYFIDRNIRQGNGHRTAIYFKDRKYTYNDVQKMVNKTANAFIELGVRIEDRVMLLLLDTPEFYACFWGAMRIGAVPVPCSTMMTAEDYKYFLNDSRARVLVASESLLPVIDKIEGGLPYLRDLIVIEDGRGAKIPFRQKYKRAASLCKSAATSKDDVGFWLYSSGSTGAPKGTIHSQYDMVVCSENFAKGVLELNENDICLSAARLFFAYGLGNANYFPLSVGAAAVLNPERPTPEGIFKLLAKYRPTIFFGVPTLYASMLDYSDKKGRETGRKPDPNGDHELSSVRLCVSAGEALPTDIYHKWKKRYGVEIIDGIGSTEMLHIFLSNRPGEVKPGSTGKPVPGYEVKLVGDDEEEIEQGEVGTLHVKGNSAAQFYWRKREKTRKTMLGEWINTGDKFWQDEDGYFWCAGRSDDMLKVGGIWVSPVEVERALTEHEAVLECAVVGRRNESGLIKPKAFVVLKDPKKAGDELSEELKAFVRDKLAKYKYPRWIEFLEELPKSPTGKIQRYKLRKSKAS
ncbi:MAG: benzoate-CoA ligase family protein [Deltaproteobacteria bacterium]|nr:benzoate-CoA ligase family protein [Deltaproteobacteria bacterium]